YIAAAGDRHLAEDLEGKWYLESPEKVKEWGFGLTPVKWRMEDLQRRLKRSEDLRSGKEPIKINNTGEEGVIQMRAILGLGDIVTNVNLPNMGQIPNLPIGAVVETNAHFSANKVQPVCAGELPRELYPIISRICGEQELVIEAAFDRDLEKAFPAFSNDPLVTINTKDARSLFNEMIDNTKEYLKMYNI
ncbi:MAG: alpha-glucosidase/alpha-galactosidase, partial [Clostridia bacterium]|nr:alpha-glucosidase/alpha-galactosidase [Clostridia bacterium]